MAKTSMSVTIGIWVGIVALIVIAGALVMNTQVGENLIPGGDADTDLPSSCDTEPYIDLTVLNRLNQGSEVSVGVDGIVNGVRKGSLTLSSQKFQVGDEVTLLLNATNYIDKIVEVTIENCAQNDVTTTIDASTAAGVSFDMWEKSTDLTDAVVGGAANASSIGDGGSAVYTLFIKGSDNTASADLVYAIELSTAANVSSVTMVHEGVELIEADMPNFYADTLTSPYKKAFAIPSFDNAIEKEYQITVAAGTGKAVNGAVYTTAYAKQAFVDNDGSYAVGVTDSDNTATKYAWTDDVDFFIAD